MNYHPGEVNTTGTITATGATITLSGTPQTVVAGTAGRGNNSDSLAPALVVSVPASNAGGVYTGTLTQSVS